MDTYSIAQKIKDHLIDITINGGLPMDMNELDISPIQKILQQADKEEAYGFSIGDVLEHAEDHCETPITEQEAKDVIEWMNNKGDVSIGISWETVSYFIGKVIEAREKNILAS